MFQRVAKVEFPTLGYWPGVFSKVAQLPANEFRGPFTTLGRLGWGGAYAFGDPVTLGGGAGGESSGNCPALGSAGCWGDPSTLGSLGFFDSGLDLGGWGVTEWLTAGAALFALYSMFSTTRRGVSRVRRSVKSSQARASRRRALQRQLEQA